MPYTLWLNERLIGETEFEHPGPGAGQRLGAFRPTTQGSEALPAICGLLGATLALKREIQRRGLDPDQESDAVLEVLEQTPEGERVMAIAKCLSELELRDPAGERLVIQSIAVTDVRELRALARPVGTRHDIASNANTADSKPRYLISATLGAGPPDGGKPRRTLPRLRPRWRR